MQFAIQQLPSITIAGIAVRTTNANNQAQQDIGALWQKFIGENIAQQIVNKLSGDVYCVYTDYAGDFNAPYTTIIGCRANATDDMPQGLVHKSIPAQTYRVYKPAGELPGSIIQTWMYIWQADVARAYAADFDVYREDGGAETWLAIV